MKTVILIILLVCSVAAADYQLVYEKEMCQFDTFICQWDIIDSNMGVVTYNFAELPPYTIVDANIGRVEFTPQEAGTFYIRLIATCQPNDPVACLWPLERREEVKITVNPSLVWRLRHVELQE